MTPLHRAIARLYLQARTYLSWARDRRARGFPYHEQTTRIGEIRRQIAALRGSF